MVSALQPFFQTKVEPCTLKLKLCLEIGYPLKWVPEYHLFNCTQKTNWYNKAVFFIENTCRFY